MKITKEAGAVLTVELQARDRLKLCPFCGNYPELAHTWTASYWLECTCGAELHDIGNIGKARDPKAHLASARRVVKAWNERELSA